MTEIIVAQAAPLAHRLHSLGKQSPELFPYPPHWRKIAMICASVYLLVFIRILLMHLAEKILLLQPLKFGGITVGR